MRSVSILLLSAAAAALVAQEKPQKPRPTYRLGLRTGAQDRWEMKMNMEGTLTTGEKKNHESIIGDAALQVFDADPDGLFGVRVEMADYKLDSKHGERKIRFHLAACRADEKERASLDRTGRTFYHLFEKPFYVRMSDSMRVDERDGRTQTAALAAMTQQQGPFPGLVEFGRSETDGEWKKRSVGEKWRTVTTIGGSPLALRLTFSMEFVSVEDGVALVRLRTVGREAVKDLSQREGKLLEAKFEGEYRFALDGSRAEADITGEWAAELKTSDGGTERAASSFKLHMEAKRDRPTLEGVVHNLNIKPVPGQIWIYEAALKAVAGDGEKTTLRRNHDVVYEMRILGHDKTGHLQTETAVERFLLRNKDESGEFVFDLEKLRTDEKEREGLAKNWKRLFETLKDPVKAALRSDFSIVRMDNADALPLIADFSICDGFGAALRLGGRRVDQKWLRILRLSGMPGCELTLELECRLVAFADGLGRMTVRLVRYTLFNEFPEAVETEAEKVEADGALEIAPADGRARYSFKMSIGLKRREKGQKDWKRQVLTIEATKSWRLRGKK